MHKIRVSLIILLMFSFPMFSSGDLSLKKNRVGMEYWHGDSGQKRIALTFDDGPSAVYTQQILDILSLYNVKATFFMVGENVAKYPQISRLVVAEGHTIENHSYSHRNLIFKSNKGVRQEIDRTERIIQDVTGTTPYLFRPPYGGEDLLTLWQTRKMGYSVVKWSVSTKDWEKPGVAKICENAYHAGNGDILLLHDGDSIHPTVDRSQTVAALPAIIEHYQSLGYEFVTVPALLNME